MNKKKDKKKDFLHAAGVIKEKRLNIFFLT